MITFTESALQQIRQMGEKEQKPYLRVGVKGGGCAGMEYVIRFETEKEEWDEELTPGGVKVLVDAKSSLFLDGTTIDYSGELLTGGFRFDNPLAKGSCGCGTSFAV